MSETLDDFAVELQRASDDALDELYWISDMLDGDELAAMEAEYKRRGRDMPC